MATYINKKYREIHRKEIKRLMYRSIDHYWEWVYTIIAAIILFLHTSVKVLNTPIDDSTSTAIVFFLAPGLLLLVVYIFIYKKLRQQFELPDFQSQFIFACIVYSTILVSELNEWLLLLGVMMSSAYATHRLWRQSDSFWRTYFFRAARSYFREINSYHRKTS